MRTIEIVVMEDSNMCASMKYKRLSQIFQDTEGFGITWAKMLNVSIGVAYPELRLLDNQCDVGIGALAPLQCLLRKSSWLKCLQ